MRLTAVLGEGQAWIRLAEPALRAPGPVRPNHSARPSSPSTRS
ncbi:hypothetical protein [Streptomyces scopuliridis]|nr:hypothetical protein [Streptomyces scopuliridis]